MRHRGDRYRLTLSLTVSFRGGVAGRVGKEKESYISVTLCFQWCHQLFNRVIEWWCTGIYIFILRGLKENLHVNLQKLF